MIPIFFLTPIKGTVDTHQESSKKLDGVTGEVLKHACTSGESARDLSSLTASSVGISVGILCLAVRTRTHKINQSVFK